MKVSYADPKNVVYIANIPRDMSHEQIVKIINDMTRVCLLDWCVCVCECIHEYYFFCELATFINLLLLLLLLYWLQS